MMMFDEKSVKTNLKFIFHLNSIFFISKFKRVLKIAPVCDV